MHLVRDALPRSDGRADLIVIGIGNAFRGDDAAGLAVARTLGDDPRVIVHEGEPIDLLAYAGPSVLKRAAPLLALGAAKKAVADAGLEAGEGLDLRQRVALILDRRDVDEADAVVEPERRVAEALRPAAGELVVDGADELLVLVDAIGLDLVAHHDLPHCPASVARVSGFAAGSASAAAAPASARRAPTPIAGPKPSMNVAGEA